MKVNFLDHVAIRVADPEVSAQWYETVLGLTRFDDQDRGGYPIMMQAGETGIALFPALKKDDLDYVRTRMHIAFNVDRESFRAFQHTFEQKGIGFSFEDHHFFHSIYMEDSDGYKVELTTPAVASTPTS
ncbi:MAG: VOC family protein [Roseivirga sp.]|nr:VOC family protein [Roseivirga sp.]